MRSHRGQATVEYVAALALVACVFAGAAVAVAAPGMPRAVVVKLRLALCVVGGDVCSPAQAAARGLEPCLLDSRQREETGGVSFAVFRVGATDAFVVERRSDGSILLHSAGGSEVAATTGLGFRLGSVQVGGDASAGLSFRSGNTWAVTQAQLRDIAARTEGDPSDVSHLDLEALLGPPAQRYREGGGRAAAELGIADAGGGPSLGVDTAGALGRRTGSGGTTYYYDLGGAPTGSIAELLPGVSGRVGAEYRTGEPPVLTLRRSGTAHGVETETVATLPLRTAADRDAAARLLVPTARGLALRDVAARIADHGTVEERRYRVTADDDGWGAEIALGAKLGADHHIATLSRRLIGALVRSGGAVNRREDCLPSA